LGGVDITSLGVLFGYKRCTSMGMLYDISNRHRYISLFENDNNGKQDNSRNARMGNRCRMWGEGDKGLVLVRVSSMIVRGDEKKNKKGGFIPPSRRQHRYLDSWGHLDLHLRLPRAA